MAEVMNLFEVEPASSPAAPGPDIPALREQLAILVSTGKYKEAIGVNLTHEHVRRLEDKEVMKHYKRCKPYVGAKTTETLIESFLSLGAKVLSALSGGVALRCGRMLAVANAFLITAKHVDFSSEEPHHPSRHADGYPLAGVDEVPTAKQSSVNSE